MMHGFELSELDLKTLNERDILNPICEFQTWYLSIQLITQRAIPAGQDFSPCQKESQKVASS